MTARKKTAKKKASKKKTPKKKATRKKTPKKAPAKSAAGDRLAGSELKKAVAKIKKLLTQRDYDAIDMGVELARSLDDPGVFEALLEGCSIGKRRVREWHGMVERDGRFIGNKIFSGTGPAQPYLDHAMFGLISWAPSTAQIDPSLVRSNIKKLDLSSRTDGMEI